MQTLADILSIPSLGSVIDFSPLTVAPEVPVLDAIALMAQSSGRGVLVVEDLQVVGWFTNQDMAKLVASDIDLTKVRISEVLNPSVISLSIHDFQYLEIALSLLRQHQLSLLPVVDEQNHLVGAITAASICQALQPSSNESSAVQKMIDTPASLQNQLRLLEPVVVNANDEILVTQTEALTELQAAQQKHERFFNHSMDLMAIADFDGYLRLVNSAWEKTLGYTQEELEGIPYIALIHNEDLEATSAIVPTLGTGEPIKAFDNRFRCKDGSYKWISWNVIPVAEEGLIYAFGRDITPAKQAQKALERLNEELEIKYQERTIAVRQMNRQLVLEMTDREQAQEQLRQSQEMLQLVMDSIPQFVFWKDTNSVYLGCNRNFAKLVGVENPEDVVGKTDYDWLCNQEEAEFYCKWDAHLIETNQANYDIIAPHLRTDGKQVWQEINKVPLHDASGNVVGILGTFQDITVRKQAQEALEKSEERFRFLAESIPQQVWIAQPDGKWEYVNQRTLDYFDSTSDQVLGWGWQQWIYEEDLPQYLDSWNKSLATGEPYEIEFRLLRASDKTYRWHLVRALAQRDRQGKIINWFGTNTDIHDRVQAEASLKKNKERFRTLVETSSDWVWEVDENVVYTYASPKIREILGYEPQEMLGKSPFHFMPSAEAGRVANIFGSIGAAKQPFQCLENTNIHKDGHIVVLETSGVPIFDADGQFHGYRGVDRDVTDRKRSEQELRQSEERFRLLVEGVKDYAIFMLDPEGGIVSWNSGAERIKGYQAEEIIGQHFSCFLPAKEISSGMAKQQLEVAAANGRYETEGWRVRKDGSRFWANVVITTLRDEAGQLRGFAKIVCDITERKCAEEALRESEELYRLMAENSTDMISRHTPEGFYLYASPACRTLLGYEPEEMVGRFAYDFLHPEDCAEIQNFHAIILEQPSAYTATYRIRCQDGSYIWFETISKTVRDPNLGTVKEIVCVSRNVTARKEAEETLRRQLAAVEAATDGIAIVNSQGEFLYLNESHMKIFGYNSANELIGKTWQELYDSDEIERIGQDIFPIVFQQGKWQGETTGKKRDGTKVPQEVSLTLISNGGVICVCRDITERKQVEERLRLRDRAIVASSNGIVISDARQPELPIIYVNPAFERITGYTAEEVIEQNWRFLQGTDTSEPELNKLRAAIQEQKNCTVVLRNYRKDGTLFWNELSVSPIYDAAGNLTHYIGIQTDITERKLAEQELQTAKDRLQAVLDAVPGLVSWINSDWQYMGVNHHLAAAFNQSPETFIGKEIGFSEGSAHFADFIRCFFASDLNQSSTEVMLNLEGEQRSYLVVVQKYQQGAAAVSVGIDITERKQLEEELRQALETEKELSELKSRFVSMTSHEFRTPLSTILSSSELLEHYRHRWTEEKQLTHLHRIQIAVKHMTQMLNDVLIIGKAEAGKLEFRPAPLDLLEYCRHVVEEVQLNASNGHTIAFSSQHKCIPSCMDERLLGHILSNLLSNAVKYSPSGSTVNFTLSCENDQAVFEIQDQGIGIPQEHLPRLFESFHRATNVGNIQGTGLGLAIVKKCVDIHQGDIAVTSEVGGGTKFTVTLPLNNQRQSEAIHEQDPGY